MTQLSLAHSDVGIAFECADCGMSFAVTDPTPEGMRTSYAALCSQHRDRCHQNLYHVNLSKSVRPALNCKRFDCSQPATLMCLDHGYTTCEEHSHLFPACTWVECCVCAVCNTLMPSQHTFMCMHGQVCGECACDHSCTNKGDDESDYDESDYDEDCMECSFCYERWNENDIDYHMDCDLWFCENCVSDHDQYHADKEAEDCPDDDDIDEGVDEKEVVVEIP